MLIRYHKAVRKVKAFLKKQGAEIFEKTGSGDVKKQGAEMAPGS